MAENFCLHSQTMHKFVEENFKDIRAPFGAGIELTAKCNLNCPHCYAKPDRNHKDMTFDEFKTIFDTLVDRGLIEAYFTGGEVLLRPDFDDIYIYAKKKGVLLSLLTNITLLNAHHVSLFKEYPVETISTSVYGCTEETYEAVTGVKGSFKRFNNALKLLYDNGIKFELKYITLKHNFHEAGLAKDFAKQFNVPITVHMDIHAMNDGSTSPVELRMTAEEAFNYEMNDLDRKKYWEDMAKAIYLKKIPLYPVRASKRFNAGFLYPCSIANQEVFITSDCKMQGCVRTPFYQYDLRTGDFDTGWEFLKRMTLDKRASSDYKCKNCENTRFCHQCVGNFMLMYGDEEHVDPFACQLASMRKDFVFKTIENIKTNQLDGRIKK